MSFRVDRPHPYSLRVGAGHSRKTNDVAGCIHCACILLPAFCIQISGDLKAEIKYGGHQSINHAYMMKPQEKSLNAESQVSISGCKLHAHCHMSMLGEQCVLTAWGQNNGNCICHFFWTVLCMSIPLVDFNLGPFPVINHKCEYRSVQCVP